MRTNRPTGIHPVLYAFWAEDGTLDEAAMRAQVEHCVATGSHGIVVLGLVTEVHKMGTSARLDLVRMVGDMIGGRVSYGVTVAEPSAAEQAAFVRESAAAGATWAILQPPPIKGISAADLIRFFGTVADASDLPVAVQNNPVNLDVSLSVDALVDLHRTHPNVSILKGEGWSVDIARVIDATDGAYAVLGGHGGIELPALLRSGGTGLIPAPDFLAPQVALWDAWQVGDHARAEAIHRRLLPAIVFMSRSVPGMLCYGKRLMAERLGLEVHDRAPALAPDAFGLVEMRRHLREIDEAIDAVASDLRPAAE